MPEPGSIEASAPVVDEQIERIAEQAEAGIGALLAAYAQYERQYFAVASVTETTVTYATGTASTDS